MKKQWEAPELEEMQVVILSLHQKWWQKMAAGEKVLELRDIADVLKITEGTDTNIRKSMESILRIADRLERTSNGKKRR